MPSRGETDMCREDALEYSDYFPEGILPFVPGTESTAPIASRIRRMSPKEYRRCMAMTPEERIEEALSLSLAEIALRLAPPL